MNATSAYRLALHLYPRAFRRAYGDDMAALFAAQRRDEGAARVVARAAVDLLATVPTQHLEAHMTRTSTTAAVVALTACGVVLAVVGGAVGVIAAAAAFGVAALIWSRGRPVGADATARWWKLLLGGAALLGALIAATTATGELPAVGWLLAMALGLASLLLMGTGIVLGVSSRLRTP